LQPEINLLEADPALFDFGEQKQEFDFGPTASSQVASGFDFDSQPSDLLAGNSNN